MIRLRQRENKIIERVLEVGLEVLGLGKRRQADWFNENEMDIEKLLERKRRAFWARQRSSSYGVCCK